jgi:hypothetical protein
MPEFDMNSLLKEDEMNKNLNIPFRFGKEFDVNITLDDGIWLKNDKESIWAMKITSNGAYSINFIFKNLFLPQGSELYIFATMGV